MPTGKKTDWQSHLFGDYITVEEMLYDLYITKRYSVAEISRRLNLDYRIVHKKLWDLK
jgi:hypothetical protein